MAAPYSSGFDQPRSPPAHGFGDHGKAVVQRSPGTNLADAEAADEKPPADARFGNRPPVRTDGLAHAGAPQHAGSLASSVVGASATQQASLSAGAGPPQQTVSAALPGAGVALQTPV